MAENIRETNPPEPPPKPPEVPKPTEQSYRAEPEDHPGQPDDGEQALAHAIARQAAAAEHAKATTSQDNEQDRSVPNDSDATMQDGNPMVSKPGRETGRRTHQNQSEATTKI